MLDAIDTRLGRAVRSAASSQGDRSGVYPLQIAQEAFAARVLLVRAAERSIDAQYYIWHADTTGHLLLEELWNAAERACACGSCSMTTGSRGSTRRSPR